MLIVNHLKEIEIVSDSRSSNVLLFEGRTSILGHKEPNSARNDHVFQVASVTAKTIPRVKCAEEIKSLL